MTLNISRRTNAHDPQGPPTVKDVQTWLNRKGTRLAVDGAFGPNSEKAVKSFQSKAGLATDGVVGPKTWAALADVKPSPSPGAPSSNESGKALAAIAYKVVTGGYRGGNKPTYVYGAENKLYRPDLIVRTDCSELAQICVSTLLKNPWVDGSRTQYAATRRISVAQALQTPGALLFVSSNGQPGGIHHVAISLGDGRTAEARSSRSGVGVFSTGIRFNLAGLVPGLKY